MKDYLKSCLKLVPLLALVAVFQIFAQAATINLDTDFNSVGYTSHNSAAGGNNYDLGYKVLILPDGKYLVTGFSKSLTNNYDSTLWRYNTNGLLDTSFNSVGYVTFNGSSNGSDIGNGLAIQADGKYVVCGGSLTTNLDMILLRYNTDGTLDTTFNSTGYATHNNAAGGNVGDTGYSVVVQSDGKIVVAGASGAGAGNQDMALWRYNSNGSLDTSFNSVGYVTHGGAAGGTTNDYGFGLALQSDGKYVVAGESTNSLGNFDAVVWRFNTDGTLDTTFSSTGYAVTANVAGGTNSSDYAYSIYVQRDGKILLGGYSTNAAGNQDFVVWRYKLDGSLDTTFNGTGIYYNNFSNKGNLNDAMWGYSAIYEDEFGRIIAGGHMKRVYTTADFGIIRLTPTGVLDTTFNGVGYVYYPLNTYAGDDVLYGLAASGDGVFALTGYTYATSSSYYDMMLMVVLDYPHTITLDEMPSLTNSAVVTGSVAAPKSTTTIGSVSWNTTNSGGTWTACTADDGTYNSLAEDFTCDISPVSDGSAEIYVRSCDQFGSCSYSSNYSYATFDLDVTAPSSSTDSQRIWVGSEENKKSIGSRVLKMRDRDFKLYFDTSDATTSVDQIMMSQSKDFEGANWKNYDGNVNMSFERDGTKHLYIKFKDEAGNISDVLEQTVKIDTHAPILNIEKIGFIDADLSKFKRYFYTENALTIEGTSEEKADLKLYINDKLVKELKDLNAEGKWKFTDLSFPNGDHKIKIVSTDSMSNKSSVEFMLIIDPAGISFPDGLRAVLGRETSSSSEAELKPAAPQQIIEPRPQVKSLQSNFIPTKKPLWQNILGWFGISY
ncbi:hypothetical protein A3K34_02710 [candidate division WWE3 bacterium RIFOXYC1_FULL_40_10]|uniref:Bacterial Ig-like domain-containing protein n=1 Tax=candidate division WWE3 bacterium RIFOXYA2_FULL_46_9 TaxID=1802636 RepID=A0A1F4W2Z0_UNCKA|nr:MAG: hypothetical protein A3K58_02710 [candidate division WWE3 bacterium RIFOXYB1_FULL_40_22]OGC61757.1 MAG: hypothetical protein A3K37_02710 [candidate division WWE3 bacterium RIFOXYA1_FULL_40_11]OGC63740.1 MAG: hypothetical protein A2264_05200 [candidate division WWE3 bacterium RIFOXYA2_FULL_46_9]OGC65193.1 MAG: hypothetical protein A2326_02440 [candidate division WWE3 bacterium RIFOXYB2_FULL_41_6]OGC66140.1 MAG: hypothetical protein A3K34_02710 [candidate division WWE3 bacterium RIFOXYC1_